MTAGLSAVSQPAWAADTSLVVSIDTIEAGGQLPASAAFCPPGNGQKDISPGLSWSAGPQGTQSYVVLLTDQDVPQDLSLINKPDTVIAVDAPRSRVFHWVLVDIPPSLNALPPGADSDGLTPGGKPIGQTPHGLRGANVYTSFLANTDGMAGTYGGYDGPCPPMNDELSHRYTFTVFAIDVQALGLTGAFTGEDAEKAMAGHILSQGQAIATYSLNPAAISAQN